MRLGRIISAVIFLAVGLTNVAYADELATSSVTPANAPVVLSHCSTSIYPEQLWDGVKSNFDIYNRSSHDLVDVSVEYRFYNGRNQQIGGLSFTYKPGESLSAQDSTTLNGSMEPVLSEPVTSIARVTCRAVGAHFFGGLRWKPGSQWFGGPLAPKPPGEAAIDDTPQEKGTAVVQDKLSPNTGRASVKFDVQRAWNDAAQDGLFIHDALVIHGGDTPATIRPANFVLTMTLENHSQKKYSALATGAPAYQKFNPLSGQYTQALQIDPNTDLGRLGSIIVPAHADVVVIVTFAITDAVADASGNREVSFR